MKGLMHSGNNLFRYRVVRSTRPGGGCVRCKSLFPQPSEDLHNGDIWLLQEAPESRPTTDDGARTVLCPQPDALANRAYPRSNLERQRARLHQGPSPVWRRGCSLWCTSFSDGTLQLGASRVATRDVRGRARPRRDRFANLVRDTRQQTGKTLHAASGPRGPYQGATLTRPVSRRYMAPRLRRGRHGFRPWRTALRPPCVQHYRPCSLSSIRAFAYLVNLNDGVTLTNAWRIAWAMLRRPLTLGEAAACSLYRLLRMPRVLLREATAALYRRRICIRPLLLVVHHFMGSTELDTNWGRPRLATCVSSYQWTVSYSICARSMPLEYASS